MTVINQRTGNSRSESDVKTKIINSALIEFSGQSYENASTNQIIKRAGISKGILFYYYRSKRALFDELIDYAYSFVLDRYISRLDKNEPDFIKRCYLASRSKMAALQENPHVFSFLANIYLNGRESLTEKQIEMLESATAKGKALLYQGIDTMCFRDDIPRSRIMKLIHWSIDGYTNELIELVKGQDLLSVDFDPYWKDFDIFLQELKKLYYRQESQ